MPATPAGSIRSAWNTSSERRLTATSSSPTPPAPDGSFNGSFIADRLGADRALVAPSQRDFRFEAPDRQRSLPRRQTLSDLGAPHKGLPADQHVETSSVHVARRSLRLVLRAGPVSHCIHSSPSSGQILSPDPVFHPVTFRALLQAQAYRTSPRFSEEFAHPEPWPCPIHF